MKILIAISISLLVFFQSVGIGVSDIFMMIDLVEHAKYHSEEHGDNFFEFLEKHYGTLKMEHEKDHQEERSQHENLPFQHNNMNHSFSEVAVTQPVILFENSWVPPAKHLFYYQDLYSFLEHTSIFQPPQSA